MTIDTDFYDDFKPIRNKLRKLNLISALEFLYPHVNAKKLHIDPEIAEFLYINLIIYAGTTTSIPAKEEKLWKSILVDCFKLKDKVTAPLIEQNVWRWLHTMGLNQLKASHNHYLNVIFRYYYIFSEPDISRHAAQVLGISYKSYLLCGMWLHAVFSRTFKYPKSYFTGKNNVGPTFSSQNIKTTLKLLSSPLNSMRDALKNSVRYNNDIFISHGHPHVTHPILEHEGFLYCMYADHLLTQLTAGTYYLVDIGNNQHQLAIAFGGAFERYVGLIFNKNNVSYHYSISGEIIYARGKRRNLKTSDWIIQTTDAIVFVECKTKKLRLNSKNLTIYGTTLSEDMTFMVHAVTQLYKVYSHYKNGLIPGLPFDAKKRFFPMVITLEDWFAGSPDTMEMITKGVKAELIKSNIDIEYIERHPFKIYSINQIELDVQLMFNYGFCAYFDKLNSGQITEDMRNNFPYDDYFNEEFEQTFMSPLRAEQIS